MPDRRARNGSFQLCTAVIGMRFAAIAGGALLTCPAWGRTADGARQGDGPGALILLPLLLVSFVALELVLWMLAPAPLQATCQKIERGRGLCLLTGVVATLVNVLLCAALGKYKGAGELIGALLMGTLLLGALVGTTAVTALLGQGILDMAEKQCSRAGVLLAGSLLFESVILFPVVGQVLGVYFVLVGLGGALLALMRPSHEGR
jgi:hypothetical protein